MTLQLCTTLDAGFTMLASGVAMADVTSDQQLTGFDVSLRERVLTEKLHLNYTVRLLASYGELQVKTRVGECDVGWAPFYQTGSRERCTEHDSLCRSLPVAVDDSTSWEPYRCCVDFSTHYVDWELAIVHTPPPMGGGKSFTQALMSVFTEPFFFNFMSFVFIFVAIFGLLVWCAERGRNPEFPERFLDGIDDGIWWAMVTVSTVGYGDKCPRTPLGRLIATFWILIGLALSSILVGHMSESFTAHVTVEREAFSLSGLRICGYPVTFSEPWLAAIPHTPVEATDISGCVDLFRDGLVDAIVMDQPVISYFVRKDAWSVRALAEQRMQVSPADGFTKPRVGLVFPERSVAAASASNVDHRTAINAALLDLLSETEMLNLQQRWFPEGVATGDALSGIADDWNWPLIGTSLGMVSLYILTQIVCTGYHRRASIDAAERVTGQDLNGDGDIGVDGKRRRLASSTVRRLASFRRRPRPAPHVDDVGSATGTATQSRVAPYGR